MRGTVAHILVIAVINTEIIYMFVRNHQGGKKGWMQVAHSAKKGLSVFAIVALVVMSVPTSVVLAAISFGSVASAANESSPGSTDDITITKPASTVSGDFLVAGITINGGDEVDINSVPSDWVLIERTDNDDDVMLATYYKFAGGSEPASYTWSFDRDDSGDVRAAGGIIRYTGVHTSSPIDEEAENEGGDDELDAPSVDTDYANDMVVVFYAQDDNRVHSTPSGTTARFDAVNPDSSGPRVSSADFVQASAGATGVKTAEIDGNEDWIAQTVALRMAPTASITIVKEATPEHSQNFEFSTSGEGLSDFLLDDDADETLSNSVVFDELEAGVYSITEDVVAGWTQTSAVCSDGSLVSAIDLSEDEDITCTFANTKLSSITIVKDTVPNDAQDFAFSTTGTGLSAFSLDDDADGTLSNTKVFSDLVAGEYTVAEMTVAGFDLTGLSCSDGSAVDIATGTSTISLAVGEDVTCTYTNTKRATFQMVKYTDPAVGSYEFTLGDGELEQDGFPMTHTFTPAGEWGVLSNLLPGSYSLSETILELPEENEYPSWERNASCNGIFSDPSGSVEGEGLALSLVAGEEMSCIVNNTQNAVISGKKFEDTDGHGAEATGSTLSGWTITIKEIVADIPETEEIDESEGTYTNSNNTNESGDYLFLVPPGTYRVCESPEPSWYQSFPTSNYNCNDEGSSYDNGYEITVEAGDVVTGKDFGNYQRGTIAGVKWHDANANGTVEDGENGLEGWTINLLKDLGGGFEWVASAVTDSAGVYEFSGEGALDPGTYQLEEVQQGGWVQTYPTDPTTHTTTLSSGGSNVNKNFGNVGDATISGQKWNDEDNNSEWDEGEDVVTGDSFTFTLLRVVGEGEPEFVIATTTTTGFYRFINLLPGTYIVLENSAEGWMQTSPTDQGGHTVTVGANEDSTDNDFGNIEVIELYGYKWNDLDKNGIWYNEEEGDDEESYEPGIQDWKIHATPIVAEGGEVATTTDRIAKIALTDEEGEYEFEFLGSESGWWRITEDNHRGWTQTYPGGIDDAYHYDVFISPEGDGDDCEGPGWCEGGYYDYNFGNWQWPLINVFKWRDVNRDGLFLGEEASTTEPGVSGTLIGVGRTLPIPEESPEGTPVPIELVALGLTGNNGWAHIPVPQQGDYVVFEADHQFWDKMFPTATRTNPFALQNPSGQTPFYIDSFFDVFAEFGAPAPFPGAPTTQFPVDSFFDIFVDMSVDGTPTPIPAPTAVDSFFDIFTEVTPEQRADSFFDIFVELPEGVSLPPFHLDSFFDVYVGPLSGGEVANGTTGGEYGTSPLRFGNAFTVACSDGLDNDGDGLIDYPADPGCGGPLDGDEPHTTGSTSSGSGGGSNGPISGSFGGSNGNGQVLGVSTSTNGLPGLTIPSGEQCTDYITENMGPNRVNNPEQVRRLQEILLREGFTVVVNGVFDAETLAAVKAFQLKYAADILAPWGLTQPTGFVYLTTKKKLNEVFCGVTRTLSPAEQAIIDGFRSGQGGGNTGGGAGGNSAPGTPTPSTSPADTNDDAPTDNSQVGAAAAATDDTKTDSKGFWGKLRGFFGL
ncbi:MAG: SdrD B-like domain-containing protein [Patescibacteria group bacterium]